MRIPRTAIVEEVIAEHAAEAAFLWSRRERALAVSLGRLPALVEDDRRLDAHLEGLALAGARGAEICMEVVSDMNDAGEAFVAGIVSLRRGGSAANELVTSVARRAEIRAGLAGALGWLSAVELRAWLDRWQHEDDPAVQWLALAGALAHRDVPDGMLKAALASGAPDVQALALRAAGELGRRDHLGDLAAGLEHRDANVRFQAARALALHGGAAAVEPLRVFAEGSGPRAEEAAALRARCLPLREALRWHGDLCARPQNNRLAIVVAGATGSSTLVPWLLGTLADPRHRRLAADALAMITGLDVERDDCDGARPPDFESGPTDDPDDDAVELDPDEELPWPAPEKVNRFWAQHGSRFEERVRWLAGRPITSIGLRATLVEAPLRHRAAAAIELMRAAPAGRALFDVRARASRQQAWLVSAA